MRKPLIGVIGVTAGLYKEKIPDFVDNLDRYFKCFVKENFWFADTISFPALYARDKVDKSFQEMKKLNVDGIIIIFLSYSPSLIIEPVLKKYNIPVLIWNTQQIMEISENFSDEDMMNNHGMHGVQDLTSLLLRNKIPFSLITGHSKQKDTLLEVEKWCRCACVANDLQRIRVGRIGGIFKDMGDFSVPNSFIKKNLGPTVINIDINHLSESAGNVPRKVIQKTMMDDKKKYIIDNNLDDKTLENEIRLEYGIRKLIEEYRIEAITINFTCFKGKYGCEAIPFASISKIMSEGVGYAGEGDALGAISVWILNKLAKTAMFTEMFSTDYKNNRIFMSHMGESNLLMAKNPEEIKLIKKDMSISCANTSTAMFLFQLKPGNITLFNLAPCGENGFRMITTNGYIEDTKLFPDITAPHFLLRINGDVRKFLTDYSLLGGTHHLAMAYGDFTDDIRMLSDILGIEFFKI
ncbi:MAG TPA: hypothetical protein PLB98_07800 [bacterium]|nr:hypothetical protein [bacterium]